MRVSKTIPFHRSLKGKLFLLGLLPVVFVLAFTIIFNAIAMFTQARNANEKLLRSLADGVAAEVERGNTRAVLAAEIG